MSAHCSTCGREIRMTPYGWGHEVARASFRCTPSPLPQWECLSCGRVYEAPHAEYALCPSCRSGSKRRAPR